MTKEDLKRHIAEELCNVQAETIKITVTLQLPKWMQDDDAQQYMDKLITSSNAREWLRWTSCSPQITWYLDLEENPKKSLERKIEDLKSKVEEFLAEKWGIVKDLRDEIKNQQDAHFEGRSLERLSKKEEEDLSA